MVKRKTTPVRWARGGGPQKYSRYVRQSYGLKPKRLFQPYSYESPSYRNTWSHQFGREYSSYPRYRFHSNGRRRPLRKLGKKWSRGIQITDDLKPRKWARKPTFYKSSSRVSSQPLPPRAPSRSEALASWKALNPYRGPQDADMPDVPGLSDIASEDLNLTVQSRKRLAEIAVDDLNRDATADLPQEYQGYPPVPDDGDF